MDLRNIKLINCLIKLDIPFIIKRRNELKFGFSSVDSVIIDRANGHVNIIDPLAIQKDLKMFGMFLGRIKPIKSTLVIYLLINYDNLFLIDFVKKMTNKLLKEESEHLTDQLVKIECAASMHDLFKRVESYQQKEKSGIHERQILLSLDSTSKFLKSNSNMNKILTNKLYYIGFFNSMIDSCNLGNYKIFADFTNTKAITFLILFIKRILSIRKKKIKNKHEVKKMRKV